MSWAPHLLALVVLAGFWTTIAEADFGSSLGVAVGDPTPPRFPEQAGGGRSDSGPALGAQVPDRGDIRSGLADAGVRFGLQEQSEVWGNLVGGLKTGAVYDGLTTASAALDLDKLAGWSGAKFFTNGFWIHGRGPSANLVGNLQLVSNIEATRSIKLYDLWLEQMLADKRLSIRIGQEGANDEMMVTQYGALFLNSSFGFPGLPAADLPSGGPNYPLATPFVRLRYRATDALTFTGAVFNGDPAPPGKGDPQLRDRHGTAFRLNDHTLSFAELWYATDLASRAGGLPGMYKLGAWYSSSHFPDQLHDTGGRSLADPESTGIPGSRSGDFAVYGIIDQLLWRQQGTEDQGLGVFLQVMGAPSEFNFSNLFIESGLNWKGPFNSRPMDSLGLGVSYLGISPALQKLGRDIGRFTGSGTSFRGNETVVEATYLFQVTPWWTLQADAQFVINPSAGIPTTANPTPLKNALIFGMRATLTF
jgi:porin